MYCTPRVHLLVRRDTFEVSNRRKIYLHIFYFQLFVHMSGNIILKSRYKPIVKYICD